jgi:Permeases of the drug/metabolite transporter (DMT) superfamily
MNKGVAYALVSALLFGISTPLSKVLVGAVPPLMLAGLLYAGSGIGLTVVIVTRHLLARERVALSLPTDREWFWLAGAIFFGGVVGPVLLMYALTVTPASTASLLLNLEVVFTALLAWFLFRENFDRRIALGLLAIVAGGVILSWQPDGSVELPIGALLIAAACLCWAVDNNLTRRVSASDATTIAALKGLVAGGVNLGLAASLGYALPAIQNLAAAAALGFVGYGVSFTLFVLALRHLGTARTGAYFSVAPFFGAAMAILMHTDVVTWQVVAAGVLMAAGVWLHVTEHHVHRHAHGRQTHSHEHTHDEHHRHEHAGPWDRAEPHTHTHTHEPLVHTHPHYPDVHHRHEH